MAGSSGSTANAGGTAGSSASAGEAPGPDVGLDNGAGGSSGGGMAVDRACANDTDTDSDGLNDCDDGCPEDGLKGQPGACGCGVSDTDLDADGTLDCQEACPADPAKVMPGVCGCGRADVDTDLDGTLDCNDACVYDAALQAPGRCGCGAPENLPLCLRHRYSFEGTGAVANDSAGAADGTIVNATLAGNGTLVLAGGVSDQYVDLPANIISRLGVSATIETWATWTGAGAAWQRIFDFGSSDLSVGEQGNGVTYLFVTPTNTINTHLRAAFTTAGPALERTVNAPTAMPFGVSTHVAVVIDGVAQTLTMYQNGTPIDVPAPTADTTLALLNDVNNWIGRSQFAPDEEFQGVIDEVRIYGVARSAAQIAAEVTAGPNTLPAQ
jgi:Concanavalin A-like lectin/glucanases superfamily